MQSGKELCVYDLFKLQHCKKTHYGQITFEMLCARAHVPLWMALGEVEPDEWEMTCDCCGQVCPEPERLNIYSQLTVFFAGSGAHPNHST